MENKDTNNEVREKWANLVAWAVLSVSFVMVDQYTKHLAVIHLKHQEPLVGILQGQQGFFFVIGIFVLVVAAYVMVRLPSWRDSHYRWLGLCVILITAGAVGNMVDRILQGYVVDFLYFRLINFPIFNVADIYVTTATGVLAVLLLFFYTEEDLDILRLRKKSTTVDND